MKNFRLTKEAGYRLADKYSTPLLVVSLDKIEENYRFFNEHLPRVKVHYAVKANPYEPIVQRVADMGGFFDVASDGEMEQLHRMGISGERMIYANPTKTKRGLETAVKTGVHRFTFDSEGEIAKMAKTVPGGTVLLRVRIDNPKALVDLNTKFGAAREDVMPLLKEARQQGLDVAGLCFHVGSQSVSTDGHKLAFDVCRELFDEAAREGFNLHILDIGGGVPIPTEALPIELGGFMDELNEKIETLFPDTEIWAEPGRYLCGTAVNLLTSVIGSQKRNNKQWYILDEGMYGSFSGLMYDHWEYALETYKTGEKIIATFAGPSCDSIDVLYRDKETEPLEIDDIVMVPDCGAYTSASATEFNGFHKAPLIIWENEK